MRRIVKLTLMAAIWSFHFFVIGCGSDSKPKAPPLPGFTVTNLVINGEEVQLIRVTNGMSLRFSETNVIIRFTKDHYISVFFDEATRTPLSMAIGTSGLGQILDANADGVPELRAVQGQSKKEVFFQGEWYPRTKIGTNTSITVDGAEVFVRFDGKRYVPISGPDKVK